MFKNWVVTVGGVMAGLGTLPMLVIASRVAFPLWWNDCQFPLILIGMLGTILMGVSAKGVDQHSTPAQMQASEDQAKVNQAVVDADAQAKAKLPDKVLVEPHPEKKP